MMTVKIILASRSPRRVELLKQIGILCETLPADIDETQLIDESP
ncbi:MAG: Maf family protein, partial [Methylotenera sp.]